MILHASVWLIMCKCDVIHKTGRKYITYRKAAPPAEEDRATAHGHELYAQKCGEGCSCRPIPELNSRTNRYAPYNTLLPPGRSKNYCDNIHSGSVDGLESLDSTVKTILPWKSPFCLTMFTHLTSGVSPPTKCKDSIYM